jgi:hypothetical protein
MALASPLATPNTICIRLASRSDVIPLVRKSESPSKRETVATIKNVAPDAKLLREAKRGNMPKHIPQKKGFQSISTPYLIKITKIALFINSIKSFHGELKIEIKDQDTVLLNAGEFIKNLEQAARFITGICLKVRKSIIKIMSE